MDDTDVKTHPADQRNKQHSKAYDGRQVYHSKAELADAFTHQTGKQLHEAYVLAFDTYDKGACKHYVYFETPHERHGFIQRNCGAFQDRHAYEVLIDRHRGAPVWLYWDVDRPIDTAGAFDRRHFSDLASGKEAVLQTLFRHFSAYLKLHYGLEFTPVIGQNAHACHTAPRYEGQLLDKLSVHVRFNVLLESVAHAEPMVANFVTYLQASCTPDEHALLFVTRRAVTECIVDKSVYSNFRCFRMLGQSKRKGRNQMSLPLTPYGASSKCPEDHQLVYHDLTAPETGCYLDLRGHPCLAAPDRQALKRHLQACPFDRTIRWDSHYVAPQHLQKTAQPDAAECMVPPETVEQVRALIQSADVFKSLLQNDQPAVTSVEPDRFDPHAVRYVFEPRSKCACPCRGRVHRHNRICLKYDHADQTVSVVCFDEDCKALLRRHPMVVRLRSDEKRVEQQCLLRASDTLGCMGDAIRWQQDYCEPSMRPYFTVRTEGADETGPSTGTVHTDKQILVIKANMGTGKTLQCIDTVAHTFGPDESVLIVTPNIALARKAAKDYAGLGFKCYLDMPGGGDIRTDRLICCIDSTRRIIPPGPNGFDVVILDEPLTELNRHSSEFMRHAEVCPKMEHILTVSRTVILMDAYVDNWFVWSFVQYLEQRRGHSARWIRNSYVRENNRRCLLTVNKERALQGQFKARARHAILSALECGDKVVCPSSSKTFVDEVSQAIADAQHAGRLPKGLKVCAYTADTDKKVLAEAIADPHAAWGDADLVIYSPTITAGVSFELPHFTRLIGYMENTPHAPTVDSCVQQLFRVRQLSAPDSNGGHYNMHLYIHSPHHEGLERCPVSPADIEVDLDKKLRRNLGAFDGGEWEVPEYLLDDRLTSCVPIRPASNKAKDCLPVWDKDRLSWVLVKGILYTRNKSLHHFTDILPHTLRHDYHVKVDVVTFKATEEDGENADAVKQAKLDKKLRAAVDLPYCPEVVLTDEDYVAIKDLPVLPGSAPVVVAAATECTSASGDVPTEATKFISVPAQMMRDAQVFVHRLAYTKYRIKSRVDKRFYDTFIGNACCENARATAAATYHKWRRFNQLQGSTLDNSRTALARKRLWRGAGDDVNFDLHFTPNQIKYAAQLVYGHEVLLELAGSPEGIGPLFEGDYRVVLKNGQFTGRMQVYFAAMDEEKYQDIVDVFGFEKCRHKNKADSTSNPRAITSFAAKILRDAFDITLGKDGATRKELNALQWKVMATYKPEIYDQIFDTPIPLEMDLPSI